MQSLNPPSTAPMCHRCKEPMAFHSRQTVGSARVNVFRCEKCDILEAFEAEKLAS